MALNDEKTRKNGAKTEEEPLESAQDEFSRCLLSQYQFCVAGVALGTGYAVKRKGTQGMLGLVVGGAVGSIADLIYGYNYACVAERDRYYRESTASKNANLASPSSSSKNN